MRSFKMENHFHDDSINLNGFSQSVVKLSYLNNSEIDFNNSDSDRSLHLPPIVNPPVIPPVIPVKSEISIVCMKCEEEIKVRQLKEHQEFHNALEMFRFNMERKPSSVKQLVKRRRAIMRRLNETANSENPVSMRKLQKLNQAYELLKADIEGTKTALRNEDDLFQIQPRTEGWGTVLNCALAFGICQHANSRWKTSMEDRFAFKDIFCNDPQSGFFAVYDGYSIPSHYDSMIGKLITYGSDRNEALNKMKRALEEYVIMGINTNIQLHQKIIQSDEFTKGSYDINFMSKFN